MLYYLEMSIYEKRLTRAGRRARGGMSGHPEREGRGGGATLQHGNPNSRFRVSEFPSFRVPSVGPQRDPNIQFPRFQVRRFRDTVPQVPVSEFPSFQGPSVGPRKDHTFQIPRFHVCRFQDTPPQLPDSKIPGVQIPGYCSANSRFRVSEFPRPPLGSAVWRYTQIPDSEFPSLRGPILGPSPMDPQIPDSEFPSFRGPLFGLRQMDFLIPDSVFPSFRGPLFGSQQVRDPQTFRVSIPRDLPT